MRVTASIGVTIFPQEGPQGLGPDQLLRHADQAMYNAKRLGRNRYALSHDLEEAGA
jgi:GGDEF domain-containing protein